MHDLINNLSSVSWWTTAVIVAVLVNLSSAYLKPWLDKRYSTWGTKRRERTEEQKVLYRKRVEEFVGNKEDQVLLSVSLLNNRLRFISFGLLSLAQYALALLIVGLVRPDLGTPSGLRLLLIGALTLFAFFGFLCTVKAVYAFDEALSDEKLVRAIRREILRLRKEAGETNSNSEGAPPSPQEAK